MVPITPAGRYESTPASSRSRPSPGTADELAATRLPLASRENLRDDEIVAVRRSLWIAFAAVFVLTAAVTVAAILSPAVGTLLAVATP